MESAPLVWLAQNQVKTVALYSGKEWDLNTTGKRGFLIGWFRGSWHDWLELFLLAWDRPISSKQLPNLVVEAVNMDAYAIGPATPAGVFCSRWTEDCTGASSEERDCEHVAWQVISLCRSHQFANPSCWIENLCDSWMDLTALWLALPGWVSSRLFVRNSKITNIQEHPGRLKFFISRKKPQQIQQKNVQRASFEDLFDSFLEGWS